MMSSASLPNPILVKSSSALQKLVESLSHEPVIAVDSESNSLFAYREQVCLIQFSVPGADYLVDPLALDDCAALGPLFSDPHAQKVFHAAEYDILCLKRDFDFEFANLFDTMLTARILGRAEVGLGTLLEIEFGVKMDKRHQRANWGQRPLPAHLLSYARMDTHYLVALRDRLQSELDQRGLGELAQEDFRRVCLVNGRSNGERELEWWRISGAQDLTPQQAAILVELCRYRDQVARAIDRPLFKVFNDKTLVEIAERAPQDLSSLAQIKGMSPGQLSRHGARLLQAVQRGQHAEPLRPPRHIRPDPETLARLDALRRWRKVVAAKMGVGSDVVLPRDLLHSLAEQNPTCPEELAEAMQGVPWRLEHFGAQILDVITDHH